GAIADGRTGSTVLRDGDRAARRARRRIELHQRASQPGNRPLTLVGGHDARTLELRVATRGRRSVEGVLRRAATVAVSRDQTGRRALMKLKKSLANLIE